MCVPLVPATGALVREPFASRPSEHVRFFRLHHLQLSQQLQAVSDKFAKQTGTNMLVAETSEVSDLSLQPQSHIRSRRHTTEPAREQVQSRQSNTRLPPIDPRQHGHTQHGHTQHSSEQGRHRRTQSVPMKTSAEIGWRSTFPSSLEIYDWPSKPKGDLVKVMKWPREGLPNP